MHDMAGKLQELTLVQMESRRKHLNTMVKETLHHTRLLLRYEKEKLAASGTVIRLSPKKSLLSEFTSLDNKTKWLSAVISSFTRHENNRVSISESKVKLLDPMNTLKRGFSITYHNNKPVKDISAVTPGDTITSQLYRGKVISVIKSKEEK